MDECDSGQMELFKLWLTNDVTSACCYDSFYFYSNDSGEEGLPLHYQSLGLAQERVGMLRSIYCLI